MSQTCRQDRAPRNGLALSALLVVGLMLGALLPKNARAGKDATGSPAAKGAGIAAPDPATEARAGEPSPSPVMPRSEDDGSRPSRSLVLRRLSSAARQGSSDGWYLGMVGITLALAVCGGLVASARRFFPQAAGAGVQIVSRVSLSPKHTVYMLRIGRRVLLVGAGPQGPPALISELDDPDESEPGAHPGGEP